MRIDRSRSIYGEVAKKVKSSESLTSLKISDALTSHMHQSGSSYRSWLMVGCPDDGDIKQLAHSLTLSVIDRLFPILEVVHYHIRRYNGTLEGSSRIIITMLLGVSCPVQPYPVEP